MLDVSGRPENVNESTERTPLEFRFRVWILGLIFVLGFAVPWDRALHLDGLGPNAHTWGLLAVNMAKTGAIGIDGAFNVVLAVATILAFGAAWLRTWGSAYVGADVVVSSALQGGALVSAGPYRHVRNPLYLGTMCLTLALAILMPASGAIFAIVAIGLFQARLIQLEEPFLAARLGQSYAEYCARVGRLMPALRPGVAANKEHPHWLGAVLAEIFPWGVALSYVAAGWRYDAGLLTQCTLVSLGVWLVARAFPLQRPTAG